jgi:hypothetical protein
MDKKPRHAQGGLHWTNVVLTLLPATVKEINSNPTIKDMNRRHRELRASKGKFLPPLNSGSYDALYELRRRGWVVRSEDGVYSLTDLGKFQVETRFGKY